MASYRGHLILSSVLGAAYAGLADWQFQFDWGTVFLGAGLTTIAGLLPDLDSDSGVPVRELFSVAAAIFPLFLVRRLLHHSELKGDEICVFLVLVYLAIRYGASAVFRRLTVHRGMFHSLPAMLIAGLAVFLIDPSENLINRLFLAGAVMIGFLSHLVLDEIFSVDFLGLKLHRNKFAGSALKFTSHSWIGTLTCYGLLALLAFLTWRQFQA